MSLFCQKCGDEVASAYRYCPACGSQNFTSNRATAGRHAAAPSPALTLAAPPALSSPVAEASPRPLMRVHARGPFAGFWRRLLAYFIDAFLLLLLFLLIAFVVDWVAPNAEELSLGLSFIFFGLLISWIYFANGESGRHQGTFGKRMLGLRVADDYGQPVGFAQASGRFFGKFLSTLPFCVGFLMIALTERKQGIHDKLAGTCVLRNGE